jgi:hypothetical protein
MSIVSGSVDYLPAHIRGANVQWWYRPRSGPTSGARTRPVPLLRRKVVSPFKPDRLGSKEDKRVRIELGRKVLAIESGLRFLACLSQRLNQETNATIFPLNANRATTRTKPGFDYLRLLQQATTLQQLPAAFNACFPESPRNKEKVLWHASFTVGRTW